MKTIWKFPLEVADSQDVVMPSGIWNKVARRDGADPMLCPVCFIMRAERAGFDKSAWRVEPEFPSMRTAQADYTCESCAHTFQATGWPFCPKCNSAYTQKNPSQGTQR